MQTKTLTPSALSVAAAAICFIPFLLAGSKLPEPKVDLPSDPKAIRFAVIGDMGTGEKAQYEVGSQMARVQETFVYNMVLMLGDNIYGSKKASDIRHKFEEPYKTLLDKGIKFYASLGNHDDSNEAYYKPFNMNGHRYYTVKNGSVEFFALDSTYMDPKQIEWLEKGLLESTAAWKICFFHHPLYSDSRYHGPDMDLRSKLEPIFQKNHVNVVLCGHEHVYERVKPHGGISYFVLGNSGQLRPHDLRPSEDIAKGFDTDQAFMLMEVIGDDLYFQTISRTGQTVDQGQIRRR